MRPGWNIPRAAALAAAAGGILMALGAAMPWISMLGGLHPLRGIIGPYGKVLLVCGIACAAGAILLARYPRPAARLMLPAATAICAFAGWIAFVQVPGAIAAMREHPFLIPAAGPGPFVVLAGAMIVLGGASVSFRTNA